MSSVCPLDYLATLLLIYYCCCCCCCCVAYFGARLYTYIISLIFLAIAFVALSWNSSATKNVFKQIWKPYSPALPSPVKHFTGRTSDISQVLNWLDFSNEEVNIVNIVGPPGIGKSALAIYVGNEVLARGESVYYINMGEFPDEQLKQVLASKILSMWNREQHLANITFGRLRHWANSRWLNTVLILDNCDSCIQAQLGAFQEAIQELLDFSDSKIKIVTTSRMVLLHLQNFVTHKVGPLDEDAACLLLESKVPQLLNATEKRVIAKLTGEIPLAVQIIGALLKVGVNPPTPLNIINSLKKNPISILSPTSLHRSMQLNATISLSYDHLDEDTKRIGRYLSLFPGSIDKDSALEILSLIFSKSGRNDNYLDPVNDLIARSLLELDTNSGRYIYHKLIKTFFASYTKLSEQTAFTFAFQNYFSKKLLEWMDLYSTRTKQALIKLDLEQHNILHFVASLQSISYSNHTQYISLISSFYRTYMSGYLNLRFSYNELIKKVNSIINNLETSMKASETSELYPIFFKIYINLILRLSNSIQDKKLALVECEKRMPFVEMVKDVPNTTEEYSHFYSYVLDYKEQIDEETAKLYHARLLKRAAKTKLDCNVGESFTTCKYVHLATSYYSINDHENSVLFYEKALDREDVDVFEALFFLSEIHLSYIKFKNHPKLFLVHRMLLERYDDLINQPSSNVYLRLSYYLLYITSLDYFGEMEKAIAIHEKVVNSMEELGNDNNYYSNVAAIYRMCKVLLELNEFDRVVKLASHGLQYIHNGSYIHEYIGLSLQKCKATYLAGNHSHATKLFLELMEFLIQKKLTVNYSNDYYEVCEYLYKLRKFDYIIDCYFDHMISVVYKYVLIPVFIIVKAPYGPVSVQSSTTVIDYPVEKYPSLTQLSKETSLTYGQNINSLAKVLSAPKFIISQNFKLFSLFKALESCNLFRLTLNFLSIYFRLFVTYIIIIFFFWSIRKCFMTLFKLIDHLFSLLLLSLYIYMR